MKLLSWTLGLFLLAGGLSFAAPAVPVEAQETCVAATLDGLPRGCTATEAMGMCLIGALDSRRACVEDFDSWLLERACDAFFVWDAAVCIGEALPKLL